MTADARQCHADRPRPGGSPAPRQHAEPQVRLSGYDRDPDPARSRGWLGRAHWGLPAVFSGAHQLRLGAPLAERRQSLAVIGPRPRAGAVAAGLGPLVGPPLAWAGEALRAPNRHFAARRAALSPAHLHCDAAGRGAASADLFQRGPWALASAAGWPQTRKLAVRALSTAAAALVERCERRAAWPAKRRRGDCGASSTGPPSRPSTGEMLGRLVWGGLASWRGSFLPGG